MVRIYIILPVLLLALCALIPVASAQLGPLPLVDSASQFVPNWGPMVAVGLAVGVALGAIAWMMGEAFNLPAAKSFARMELYELGMSAFIVGMIVASLWGIGIFVQNITPSTLNAEVTPFAPGFSPACADNKHLYDTTDLRHPENYLYADVDWFLGCVPGLGGGTTGGSESNPQPPTPRYVENSQSYYEQLQEGQEKGVMLRHMLNIYTSLLSLELVMGPVSTLGVSFYTPEPLVSSIAIESAPHAGLTPISEMTIMLTDLIGVGMGAIVTQKVLLQFFHQNALSVFLPLGLAFRAIPFLRKTGSTIIAAAFVMYLIFPMTIWINQNVYFAIQKPGAEVMIPWTNYQTLVQYCARQAGESEEDFKARMEQVAKSTVDASDKMQTTVNDAFGGPNWLRKAISGHTSDSGTALPFDTVREVAASLAANLELILGYFFYVGGVIPGTVLPVDFLFNMLVDQITTSMQWFVLNLLFLVNTIILTVTLFRDLSLAIGGEPRIFGMSKLI